MHLEKPGFDINMWSKEIHGFPTAKKNIQRNVTLYNDYNEKKLKLFAPAYPFLKFQRLALSSSFPN